MMQDAARPTPGTAAAVGLGVFALYAWTAAPSIYWKDSAEFTTVVHYLDVAHPAGSPAYSLLGKLFDLLPLADVAVRVNFFTGAAAALAAALLYLLCAETLAACGFIGADRRRAALVSTALFALGASFWTLAATTEVYPLQCAAFAAVLLLLLRWRRSRAEGGEGDLRLLAAAALLYGASGGVHAALGFTAPAVLLFLAATLGTRLFRERILLTLAAAAAVGLSVYAYLPLRTLTGRLVFSWGNPATPERFLEHLLVKKDAGIIRAFDWSTLPGQLALAGGFAAEALTAVGAALGIVGFVVLARRAWDLALLTGAAFALYAGFFLRYWTTPDIYMPGFLLLALWSAPGLGAASDALARRLPQAGPRWVWAPAAALVLWHGALGYARAEKREDRHAHALARASFLTLPEGAMAFPVWQWFQVAYLQEIEGRRPDLQVIGPAELKRPEWFRPVSRERFPELRLPEEPLTAANFGRYMPALLSANIGERRAFIEIEEDTGKALRANLVPRGLLFEIAPDGEAEARKVDLAAHFEGLRAFLEGEIARPEFFENRGAAQTYAVLTVSGGLYFLQRGAPEAAIALFRLAGIMDPEVTDAQGLIGQAHHSAGAYEKAEPFLRASIAAFPARPGPRLAMGRLLLDMRRWDEAEAEFRAALRREPESAGALLGLAFAEIERGELGDAERRIAEAERAGADAGSDAEIRKARNLLEEARRAAREGEPKGAEHVSG